MFEFRKHYFSNHSSAIPSRPIKTTANKKNDLLNIIHDQLTKPINSVDQRPPGSMNHLAIQCSPNDFNEERNSSERILIGHATSSTIHSLPTASPPPGFNERGIQVDLTENNINSLEDLIEFYTDLLPIETIKEFYGLCNNDISWARSQIDEYLENSDLVRRVPSLRQLSLNALNQWNEQIKSCNPSFDTISIGDLLQDINDEDVSEEFILDDQNNANHLFHAIPSESIELSNSKQMTIPWTLVHSLQELYGELPNTSTLTDTTDSFSLPMDDELSISVYQALQRFLGVSNQVNQPVNEKKSTKKNKKQTTPPLPPPQKQLQQQWTSPRSTTPKKQSTGPLLKDIMDEEMKSLNTQKQAPVRGEKKVLFQFFVYEIFLSSRNVNSILLVNINSNN